MVRIKLSVAFRFILVASVIAPIVALPTGELRQSVFFYKHMFNASPLTYP